MADVALNQINAAIERFNDAVARADDVGVVAGAAREDVGAGIAGENVVQSVTGTVDIAAADEGQILDIGQERVSNRGLDGVSASAEQFGDHVGDVVDEIGIVASTAEQRIGAEAAVEDIGCRVTGQDIIEFVTGEIDSNRCSTRYGGVLEVGAEGIGARCGQGDIDLIGALADAFGNRIGQDIHHVGVVAQTADQSVIAQTAVKDVVRSIPGEGVGQGVAGEVELGRAGAAGVKALQIGTEGQGGGRGQRRVATAQDDRVGAFVHVLGDRVLQQIGRGQIDLVSVVASAALEGVYAITAVKRIVAAIAGKDVGVSVTRAAPVGATGEGQILDVGCQGMADVALNQINAAIERFNDAVARADDVGVVAQPTDQGVVSCSSIENVSCGIASEDVGQFVAGEVDVNRRATGDGGVLEVGP